RESTVILNHFRAVACLLLCVGEHRANGSGPMIVPARVEHAPHFTLCFSKHGQWLPTLRTHGTRRIGSFVTIKLMASFNDVSWAEASLRAKIRASDAGAEQRRRPHRRRGLLAPQLGMCGDCRESRPTGRRMWPQQHYA